jgi:hypothetical protein
LRTTYEQTPTISRNVNTATRRIIGTSPSESY